MLSILVVVLVVVVVVDVFVGVFTIDINFDDSTKQFVQIIVSATTTFLLPKNDVVVVNVVGVGDCSCNNVRIYVKVRYVFSFVPDSFLYIKQRAATETVHTSFRCNNLGLCRRFLIMARLGRNE